MIAFYIQLTDGWMAFFVIGDRFVEVYFLFFARGEVGLLAVSGCLSARQLLLTEWLDNDISRQT